MRNGTKVLRPMQPEKYCCKKRQLVYNFLK